MTTNLLASMGILRYELHFARELTEALRFLLIFVVISNRFLGLNALKDGARAVGRVVEG